MDNLTGSGVSPDVELMVGINDSAGNVGLYRWDNAPFGNITFVENGLEGYKFSKINSIAGGSERIWSGSGSLNISQPCLAINGPNIEAKFKVWGSAQSGVSAQLLFNPDRDPTMTLGTLVSSDVGTVVGDTLEGLVADNVTEITLVWAAALDGVLTGDNPRVALRVFI